MIRIVAPHFVGGIIPGVRCAPIIGYMRQWGRARIEAYCHAKGWGFEWID